MRETTHHHRTRQAAAAFIALLMITTGCREVSPPSAQTYTVQAGDSFYRIASKTGTDPNELAAVNGMTLKSYIFPGDVLKLPSGATGRIRCSLWSSSLLSLGARVEGERATMKVRNFTLPHVLGGLTVRGPGVRRRERAPKGVTYRYQLDAFADAVLRGGPVLTPPSDSIATMEVIDAAYAAAGLPLRGT